MQGVSQRHAETAPQCELKRSYALGVGFVSQDIETERDQKQAFFLDFRSLFCPLVKL